MVSLIEVLQIGMLGYALGSIPFGVLLAKLFKLPDPRSIGSGNIGATNMLRAGNKKVAALTLLLDMLKGAAAVWLTIRLFPLSIMISESFSSDCLSADGSACEFYIANPHLSAFTILAAALGHMYSPWLRFKGGKGVATLFGGALAFSWPVAMAGFFVWAMVVFTTRYVSLGSILALAAAPLIAWLRVDGSSALILAVASTIAIWKHRENIKRLTKGFEPKIYFGRRET